MIKIVKIMVMTFALSGAGAALATAATITNGDAVAQTVIVIEGASKQDLVVGSGDTVSFCPSGCFVTMPNGDREALNGGEAVTISGGQAKIK